MNEEIYDVVIVGGGLSGMSLSCLLGSSGMRIACVDMSPPIRDDAVTDLRTTAISYGSAQILSRAGIWDTMVSTGQTCAIRDIKILDGSSPVLLNFLSGEVDGKAFGWIVDNMDLRRALQSRIEALPCIRHIAPATVKDFSAGEDYATVMTSAGTLKAKLIIGADGRKSSVRKWMEENCNLRVREWSYKQRAIICNVAHDNPHDNIAVEHFYPQGPFAILPMSGDKLSGAHRSSVVFTEHGPEEKSMMRLSDEEFLTLMQARFPEYYGRVKMITPRAAYPLGLVHAADYIAPRMALVADAAHGIHPIAGQGLNLGFRDLDAISTLLTEAYQAGGDIGAADILQTYQRRRRPDNMAMIAVTDGLNRLFSNDLRSVRLLRRAGLRAVSKIGMAKRFFMRQAMGDR